MDPLAPVDLQSISQTVLLRGSPVRPVPVQWDSTARCLHEKRVPGLRDQRGCQSGTLTRRSNPGRYLKIFFSATTAPCGQLLL